MKKLNKQKIIELLKVGENKELEFKEAKNKIPKSMWETYSAFCNSKGGIIVLGIKENSESNICTIEGVVFDKLKVGQKITIL